jgi:hypothetical protein
MVVVWKWMLIQLKLLEQNITARVLTPIYTQTFEAFHPHCWELVALNPALRAAILYVLRSHIQRILAAIPSRHI